MFDLLTLAIAGDEQFAIGNAPGHIEEFHEDSEVKIKNYRHRKDDILNLLLCFTALIMLLFVDSNVKFLLLALLLAVYIAKRSWI